MYVVGGCSIKFETFYTFYNPNASSSIHTRQNISWNI